MYELVRALHLPTVTTPVVRKALAEHGRDATGPSVRNHLRRLAEIDKLLIVIEEGVYALPNSQGESEAPN